MQSGKGIMKKIDDMIDNILDEVMSKLTRMRKSRMMKTKGKQIARKRKIAMKRRATPEKLKTRAVKKARDIITKKILKDKDKSSLSIASREKLEKKLQKKKAVIQRIAKKLLPKVRSAESERLKKKGEKEA